MAVRKELLQRELTKLGVRKAPPHAGGAAGDSGRPQADAPADTAHGD